MGQPGKADRELLAAAIGDLFDAKRRLRATLDEVLPVLRDPPLAREVERLAAELATQMERLDPEVTETGQPNLWMQGVVGDARRDAETQPEGVLRDIALAGALGKGVAASRVSTGTAIHLAARLLPHFQRSLLLNHGEEAAMEAALAAHVARLCDGLADQPPSSS